MEEVYFVYSVYIVCHIFQLFYLRLVPFINYFIIELGLIFSKLDYFIQELVLLVLIAFDYFSLVKS